MTNGSMTNVATIRCTAISRSLPRILLLALTVLCAWLPNSADARTRSTSLTISGTPATSATVGQAYAFTPTVASGGRSVVFSIRNRPSWATFDWRTGKLAGTPASAHVGTYSNIVITVTTGRAWASLAPFSITVTASGTVQTPTNTAPTISGTPPTTGTVGAAWSFTPSARDAEGNALTFSVANKPAWANLDATTGRLSGTPTASGTHSNIVVSVSDGKLSASLPAFSIAVQAAPVAANNPPTISGTPSTTATVGTPWTFKPTAADKDGDTISFSVVNRPTWANFSIADGSLSGTPTATGSTSGITISVSDGKASTSLAPFVITVAAAPTSATASVTLSWDAPTQNSDGTPLTDLAGYRVSYGTSATALTSSLKVAGATTTSVTIPGLARGTWYFNLRSYNAAGAESDPTATVSKTIP